jgi:hypothetical protein
MSASTMTSGVLALGTEVSPVATPAHSPHGGEMGRREGLCQGRVLCAARRVIVHSECANTKFDLSLIDRSKLAPDFCIATVSRSTCGLWGRETGIKLRIPTPKITLGELS